MHRCRITYRVERQGPFWTVAFGGCPNGCYRTRCEALHSAASDARRVWRLGHAVKVEVARPPEAGSLPVRVLRRLH